MTETQIAHVMKTHDAIRSVEARHAFFHLLIGTTATVGLHPLPLPRGTFSAIHLATKSESSPYGDAEFALKGAQQHITWWFRPPAFKTGIVHPAEVETVFSQFETRSDGHIKLNVTTFAEADQLLAFLSRHIPRDTL